MDAFSFLFGTRSDNSLKSDWFLFGEALSQLRKAEGIAEKELDLAASRLQAVQGLKPISHRIPA